MANRPKVPEKLRQELLYESAFACVVCQARRVQIHHIDQNNKNNIPVNLVLLCHDHHDDAHATKSLSQNLTPARLKEFKKKWINQVQQNRNMIATLEGQLKEADSWSGMGILWGYINHRRVSQLLNPEILKCADQNLLGRCQSHNVVDQSGILLQPKGWVPEGNYIGNTVYDWFPHGDDHALHKLYSDFVDKITQRVIPIHLEKFSWTKSYIGNCLHEGQFIFFTKAQYFKQVSEDTENAHLRVKTTLRKITIEYYIDTMNMFGVTSIAVSFTGHKVCSSLLQVKSIEKDSDDWTIHCTPIALGVGFRQSK